MGKELIEGENQTHTLTVKIENPKNRCGARAGKDISDHYPIIISDSQIKVVSYNLQLMPQLIGGAEGKQTSDEIRAAVNEVVDYFDETQADVCCVQELFDNEANALLEQEMINKGYIATSRVGSEFLAIFNGGARTFVKRDHTTAKREHYEHIYSNKIDYFIGADALANKGVTHTPFTKNGTNYHVFNTHLQAFYQNRDHYAEVTLAQCIELKRFIEQQRAQGIIQPGDKILICGDFNIPKKIEGFEANGNDFFLFEKMKRILGPHFIFLDHSAGDGTQHTLSSKNSYNTKLKGNSDMDITVDLALEFNPERTTDAQLIEIELSEIYADIQLAIAHYVRTHATVFTRWTLSESKQKELKLFNEDLNEFIKEADKLVKKGQNPHDNTQWFKQALSLLRGPGKIEAIPLSEPSDQEPIKPCAQEQTDIIQAPNENTDDPIADLNQARQTFDKLMLNLKDLHAQIQKDYRKSPKQYRPLLAASLILRHTLFNAGHEFFKNPNPTRVELNHFNDACETALNHAGKVFDQHISTRAKFKSILEGFANLIKALLKLPIYIVARVISDQYKPTLFKPSSAQKFKEIIDDFTPLTAEESTKNQRIIT